MRIISYIFFFLSSISLVVCFYLIQVPLYVATKMASIRRSSFFVPSSDGYARAALGSIGYEPRCTPYWPHSFLWCLLNQIPEAAIDSWRLGFCLGIRKKGLQKDTSRKKEQLLVCSTLSNSLYVRLFGLQHVTLDTFVSFLFFLSSFFYIQAFELSCFPYVQWCFVDFFYVLNSSDFQVMRFCHRG